MHGAPKYTSQDTNLSYANPDAPKGGAIKHAAIGTFDTLNPFSIKGKAAQGLNLVYDRLMGRVWDEPFSMYPLIATRYETNAERSFITFHIDKRARFHDGTPITSEDVLFSFETLKESGRPNMRRVYRLVKEAKVLCPETVFFEFGEGYDRETAMILAMMPVLSKAYWEGREFDSTTLDIPVSSGPYRIKDVDVGRSITYERDPDYWAKDLLVNKGLHNFDTITYEYYRDDTVAFESFKSGGVDLRREYDAGKWESAYDFPALTSGEIIKSEIVHSRPERAHGFIFNTRRAPFDDIRVRKALNMLMDHNWINQNIYRGQYRKITSYFPNSEFEAAAEATNQAEPFNLRRNMRAASTLLEESGWEIQDGALQKDGQPFTFEILLNAPEEEKIALHYRKNLERLGIDMRIRVMDSAAFRGRLNDYDFDMVSYFWQSSLSPGTEQVLYWGCEAANQPARWNFPGICTEEIETLSKAVANTKDRDALVETMRKLDAALMAGHYMIPLFYRGSDYIAHQADIQRPAETPIYGAVLETWWSHEPASQ